MSKQKPPKWFPSRAMHWLMVFNSAISGFSIVAHVACRSYVLLQPCMCIVCVLHVCMCALCAPICVAQVHVGRLLSNMCAAQAYYSRWLLRCGWQAVRYEYLSLLFLPPSRPATVCHLVAADDSRPQSGEGGRTLAATYRKTASICYMSFFE